MNENKDFLRTIVDEDLKSGKYKEVITQKLTWSMESC